MIEALVRHERKSFLNRKHQALHVAIEDAIEMFFVDAPEDPVLRYAGIGENDIEKLWLFVSRICSKRRSVNLSSFANISPGLR